MTIDTTRDPITECVRHGFSAGITCPACRPNLRLVAVNFVLVSKTVKKAGYTGREFIGEVISLYEIIPGTKVLGREARLRKEHRADHVEIVYL